MPCRRREPRAVPDGDRRRSALGVFQGKIIVRPHAQKTDGRMMSRGAAPLGRRRGIQQAGARDLRRRCAMRPWRDLRPARRGPAVLLQGARPPAGRSRGDPRPGLLGRGDRDGRERGDARGAFAIVDLAEGAVWLRAARPRPAVVAKETTWTERSTSAGDQAPYDVAGDPRRFPGRWRKQRLWQAARLSRQWRLGPEAARGDRSHGPRLSRTNMPMSIAACISSPMRRRKPMRAPAKPCAPSSTRPRRTRSSSPRSATEAINLVAASIGRLLEIGEGDEIVLSIMEHHSNIVPWHFLRERNGAVIKWVPVGDDGSFDLEAFEALLTPRTKIVAITHMSNVLGTVTPMKDDRRARPCARHPGAGRRQPGRGAPRRGCPGSRRRFLRLHRAQGLWADGHRRALRQAQMAGDRCPPSTAAAR